MHIVHLPSSILLPVPWPMCLNVRFPRIRCPSCGGECIVTTMPVQPHAHMRTCPKSLHSHNTAICTPPPFLGRPSPGERLGVSTDRDPPRHTNGFNSRAVSATPHSQNFAVVSEPPPATTQCDLQCVSTHPITLRTSSFFRSLAVSVHSWALASMMAAW